MAKGSNFDVVAFATAWGARHGGINSFNMDLLQSLASAYRHALTVTCIVPSASREEVKSAQDGEVRLLSLDLQARSPAEAADAWDSLPKSLGALEGDRIVWLGHDRITGDLANQAAKRHGGRSIVIHHMSYAHYESFAENSAIAHQKYIDQKKIFEAAGIRLAVGPLLREALAEMLDLPKDQVVMLVPGLPEISPKLHGSKMKAFMSGRLGEGAAKIKQANLAIAAFAHSVKRCDNDTGLPTLLRGESEPSMVLRGMNWEGNATAGQGEEEKDLLRFAESCANRALNIRALAFTEDRDQLFDDVRSSSVCLMPSWHEGFGLVAWESIAAGVPVIISNKSGVHQLLSSHNSGSLLSWYESIDVRGCTDEPYFREEDKALLSDKIIGIAKNLETWKERARHLREAMLSEFSWAGCADTFVDALGWGLSPVSAHGLMAEGGQRDEEVPTPRVTAAVESVEKFDVSRWVGIPQPGKFGAAGISPSHLLRAEEALMPFDKNALPFVDAIIAWVVARSSCIEAKLIVGQGGVGKTRTAIEVCKLLQQRDVVSGFLIGDLELRAVDELVLKIRASRGETVCIVVDYAETRTDVFLRLLSGLVAEGLNSYVRILLLARAGGDWWDQLHTRDVRCAAFLDGTACTGPFEMPMLYKSDRNRAEAYDHALEVFSGVLNLPKPRRITSLAPEHYGHPLFVHMAALMSVLGEHATTAENLSRSLLIHERRYWRMARRQSLERSEEEDYARLMALASLCDGVSSEKSIEKEWLAAGGAKTSLPTVFRALVQLYPGRQGLEGLKPDILGEALVAQSVLAAGDQQLLDSVLSSAQSGVRHSGATCVARALRHRPDLEILVERSLVRCFHVCCKELVRACVETGGPLPDIAARAFSGLPLNSRLQIAKMLEADFAQENTPLSGLDVAIEEANYDIALKRASKHGSSDARSEELARSLHNLSEAYRRDGQSLKSFEMSQRSEALYAKLYRLDQKRYGSDWARALGSHGSNLCSHGMPEESLPLFERAEKIYRELISKGDASRMIELSNAIGGAAIARLELGDNEGALSCSRASLDICLELAAASPDEFNGNLALSLNNYANRLSDVGRLSDAMDASKRSLEIQRKLATDRPERYEANFATALNNHATFLSASGFIKEALSVSLEAKSLLERLVAMRPDRFDEMYATTLGNASAYLFEDGDFSSAVESALGSVRVVERLYVQDPVRYSTDLEAALMACTCILDACGQSEAAIEYCARAVEVGRKLSARNEEKYSPLVVRSLSIYGRLLFEIGDVVGADENLSAATKIKVSKGQRKLQDVSVRICNAEASSAIARWLVSEEGVGFVPRFDVESLSEPALSGVLHSRAVVMGMFSTSNDELREAIALADEAWARMHAGQRCYQLDDFVLASVLAESRLGDVSRRSQILEARSALLAQRGGSLSRWLTAIAGKLRLDI